MKKFKQIFMMLFLLVLSFTFVNVEAFNTNKNAYTDCVSADLSTYGAPNKTQICKLYSVVGDDTVPESTVFCLEAAKDIVYASYNLQSTTNSGLACAVLDVINDATLSSAIGISAYDWNGTTGEKIYIDSYNNINLTNFVTIQKYIWEHEKAGTGTCTAKNTEIRDLDTVGTLSPSASKITLTKLGDNYVGSFTVSSTNLTNGYTYAASSSDVNLIKSGDTITVSVPASKVNGVKNYTITLNGSYNAKQTLTITPFMESYKAVPGTGNVKSGENSNTYQSLGKMGFIRSITTTAQPIEKKVSVEVKPLSLTIKKVDTSNNLLDGATVKVTKDNAFFKEVVVTNGQVSIPSAELEAGKYCLTEVTAPSGYVKTNISECVTLSTANPNGTITLTNRKTSVSFKKIDASTEKGLAGATLQILDKDKNVILNESGKAKHEWVSTTEAHIIDGLPVGTYYLKEVSAPSGYSLNSELIEFTINNDGSVISKNQNNKETYVIIMENKKTVTSFSKQDATTGKELPGATLQILDKDKKEIKDKDGKVLYKWVSTDKPHIIDGLPVGTYYLKETIQPKGYELNEELVRFEVKTDGTITKVVMKNTPVVEVPDTASAKSILLIVLGSLIGIGGIALIIYTIIKRKNSKI